MTFKQTKPYIIATIPHYDDKQNIKYCYNDELFKLVDCLILFYGRVKNYPQLSESAEKSEIKSIREKTENKNVKVIFLKENNEHEIIDKRQMIKVLYSEVLNHIKTLPLNENTPVWLLRLDSDEEITPKLREELQILTKLDYIYTIFLKERHFINKNEVIIGTKGWDIEGNKFIPRLVKIFDGKDLLSPIVPFHHSTTYALMPNKKIIPFSSLPYISSNEILIHRGHCKSKKAMRRKEKFYRKRGDILTIKNDFYVPTNHPDEKRLRLWFKNKDFEGVHKLLLDKKK